MKKKIIALMVLSSVGLVLGGLIYLGISSCPEILESKKNVIGEEANEAPAINNETIIVEEDIMFEQPVLVDDACSSASADYIPSFFDDSEVVYIDSPSESISLTLSSDSFAHFKEEPIILEFYPTTFDDSHEEGFAALIDEPIEEIAEENTIYEEHVLYTSSLEDKDEAPLKLIKTPKIRANKNQTIRSNQAVVETSLIVIGAVDLLSVILIKRRRRLFR